MTSTLRFNLGDVRLRDEERRELAETYRVEGKPLLVTESRLTRAHSRDAQD